MKEGNDMEINIDNSIRQLRGKFLEISSLGYVKTVRQANRKPSRALTIQITGG
jgi:hypothetical protein